MTGIWHGANWTFIVWGLAYFVMLVTEKYVIKPEQFKSDYVVWMYRMLVCLAVVFCWVIFRADSLRSAGQYIKSMLGLYGNPLIDNNWLFYSREYVVLLIFAVMLSTPLVRYILQMIREKISLVLFEVIKTLSYVFLFIVCISYLVMGAHNPFIYFNF